MSFSQKDTYGSSTPLASSSRTSIDQSWKIIKSPQESISNFSDVTDPTAFQKALCELSGHSNDSPISDYKAFEKETFSVRRNQSQSTLCTIREPARSDSDGSTTPTAGPTPPQAGLSYSERDSQESGQTKEAPRVQDEIIVPSRVPTPMRKPTIVSPTPEIEYDDGGVEEETAVTTPPPPPRLTPPPVLPRRLPASLPLLPGESGSISTTMPAPTGGAHPVIQWSHIPDAVQTWLTPKDLRALWGRVGVHVGEAASSLFNQSKRTPVGDGSYEGFINEVFSQVPNALPPQALGDYGILIYERKADQVHIHLTDILPGDVVVLDSANLWSSDPIHTYTHWTGLVPCLGVVSKFEPQKLELQALQANYQASQTVRISFASSYVAECVFCFLDRGISKLQAGRPEKWDD
jgi:myosin tail region-interacting protein MTI1